MYKCQFCDKIYNNTKSFSSHTKRSEKYNFVSECQLIEYLCNKFYGEEKTKLLLEKYINQELCVYDLSKEYSYIVQLLTALSIKRSNSQEKRTKRYKKKYLSTIQDRYGPEITNVSQIESVRKKINETLTVRYGSTEEYFLKQQMLLNNGYFKYCSDPQNIKDRQIKIQETVESKYNVSNVSQIPEVRTKISNARKREAALLTEEQKRLRTEKARRGVKFESSLEIRVKKCLVELYEQFLPHQFLWGYNFDILLKDKILIEVNGDFWHANPNTYVKTDLLLGELTAEKIWDKDKKKIDKAFSKGYIVITIWENEIRKLSDAELALLIYERIHNVRCNR